MRTFSLWPVLQRTLRLQADGRIARHEPKEVSVELKHTRSVHKSRDPGNVTLADFFPQARQGTETCQGVQDTEPLLAVHCTEAWRGRILEPCQC